MLVALLVIPAGINGAYGAVMRDYCVKPPLIGSAIPPNLLMILDNSASMYDLIYEDLGAFGTCSVSGAFCAKKEDCPEWNNPDVNETCQNIITRTPTYCYDETYNSKNIYQGYFEISDESENPQPIYYKYDSTGQFIQTASFPASCDKYVANTLCIDDADPPSAVTNIATTKNAATFIAAGNYLNWLAMSKFDIQKKVLTGGKYDATNLVLRAESRGCVGRKYLKEAMTADFVNYANGGVDTNASLGITFGIGGPTDPFNPTAPSPGGETNIKIYMGDYSQADCQDAISSFSDPTVTKSELINDIEQCLGYSATSAKACMQDNSITCTNDANCVIPGEAGICGSTAGVCPASTGWTDMGTCAETNPNGGSGTCNVSNGTCVTGKKCVGGSSAGAACTNDAGCPGGSCANKTCSGGGKAGSACNNDADCAYSTCSNISKSCASAADCLIKTCGGTGTIKDGAACTAATDCKYGKCSAGKPNTTPCLASEDCTLSGICTSGPKLGSVCSVNADCSTDIDKGPCLAPVTNQIKSTFAQSMHSCYQSLFKSTPPGQNEITQISNPSGCGQIYKSYSTCFGGSNDGLQCLVAADCPSGTCIKGPNAIRPGNPILVCSSAYTGYCATSSDNWDTTTWVAREYADADACILAKYNAYCGATQVVPVIDPSTGYSTTSNYANLPAIMNDIGVEAQLGQPIKTMQVLVKQTEEPTNLLQAFGSDIRMGAMTFNLDGTPTECVTNPAGNQVPCPKKCSTSPDPSNPIMCGSPLDCPSPATATCDPLAPANKDGAKLLHYIGSGYCYSPTATACVIDANCGAGQKCISKKCYDKTATQCVKSANCTSGYSCVSDGAGSHTSGLVKAVDDIRATSWTPFAEAYYNAIGYLAKDYSADPDGKISRTDLRINDADFDSTKNPSELECQRNTILFITDGMSTADQNANVTGLVNTYFTPSTTIGTCPNFSGSQNLDDLAYLAKNYDINTFSTLVKSPTPTQPLKRHQQIQTFVAFNGVVSGESTTSDCNNKTLLQKTATNGGSAMQEARNYSGLHTAINNFFQSVAADTVSGTAASVLASGEGSGANLVQAVFYPSKAFEQGSEVSWLGRLSNMWYFIDPQLGNSNIREDNGDANMADTTTFTGDKILNLETSDSSGDYITQLYFDSLTKSARAHRWGDSNGDGLADSALTPDIKVDEVATLWEAGKLLWSTGTGTSRTILTYNVSGAATADNMLQFKVVNRSVLRPYLNKPADWLAAPLILWVRGNDYPKWGTVISDFRKRQAIIGGGQPRSWKLGDVLNSTPKISTWQPMNVYHTYYKDATYGPTAGLYESSVVSDLSYLTTHGYKGRGNVYAGANDGMLHAFRLGKLKLNWTGQNPALEKARLANGTCSTNPHIYCYSNDDCPTGDSCALDSATLGQEVWAYIPKNVLPYLQYMADPTYCHVYSVDLTPVIYDVSITKPSTCADADYSTCPKTASTWNTVLIGGMRLGGGCRKPGTCSVSAALCTKDTDCPSGQTCDTEETCGGSGCVYTPILDPANAGKGLGYSSYFALDITNKDTSLNQNKPKLLWEFDGTVPVGSEYKNYLGYATSGPAVVRVNTKTAANQLDANGLQLNGKWFVVFGSGPTGPIDAVNYSFLGKSDQNLKLFVFDLALGPGANNSNVHVIDTLITEAFAGNLPNGTFDVDRNYADEVVYVPYVYKSSVGDFNNGGIGRLLTRESTNPAEWDWSVVVDNTGPITTGTAKLRRNSDSGKRSVWLFFGAGRFYYHIGNDADDANPANQRQLFGMKDPCVNPDEGTAGFFDTCPAAISLCNSPVTSATCAGLTNVDDVADAEDIVVSNPDYKGWYVNMDPEDQYPKDPTTIDTKWFNGERTITDPAVTQAGIVYFTSFRPYKDACEMGGITHLWALLYDTGGAPTQYLKGKAIIQVSTGSIEQIDLASAFTLKGGRKTAGIIGVPPTAQGISVMAAPGATRRPVQIRER